MYKKSKMALTAVLMSAVNSAGLAQEPPKDRSQDLAWHSEQQNALASRSYQDGWTHEEGGVLWRRIAGNGSGARPLVADTVQVHYEGTFTDGSKFDSSYDRGEPATFPLGRLIRAWQLAIPEMGIGDTIEIAVPASMGYGPKGRGDIPGGATLLFKIELLDIAGR